ncbi:MAG: glycosyl hydrolase family 28-related protein [Silvibacterium sp.]
MKAHFIFRLTGRKILFFGALVCMAVPSWAASWYTHRLDDPTAVYLTPDKFSVRADGVADDSAAVQQAIDKVQETTEQGIVFIPSGRYRISKTIYVWPGVRVIGYGATRPVIVLGKDTPGFQQGMGYMVFFAGGRPGHERGWPQGARHHAGAVHEERPMFPGTVPPTSEVIDANPGTFYSAMSNIDFEIGDGNPAAVGIRFHVAQHCYLAHMDFHIGSGLAALHDIGNEAEDLHFYGGQYGIITRKPSPGWQFTLLDSTFEGQSVAAIKEHEAGLTLIHDQFKNIPEAISIDPTYPEELWVKSSRFEDITGPAVTISNEYNARTEINFEDVVCNHVPLFALFRESGKKVAGPDAIYKVKVFSHGLTIPDVDAKAEIQTAFQTEPLSSLPDPGPRAIRDLPARDTWVNIRTLGVKGDGVTDDTEAIQKAIDEDPTLYIPSGRYLVSDTIMLKPNTVLIGLHPSTTQFDIADSTPAFQGPGAPKPLLETPKGGTNIVTGIGLYTGGINSRAVGAMWMAGADSLMDDVRFLGGHGTNNPDGTRVNPYNNTHTADPDLAKRWDGQYPSLWVIHGGGGTFADIWTPDTFAQAGLYVSDTDTPGYVYELSSEHHVRNEVKLNHVSNWEIFALQTEEERGEGPFALPLEIDHSNNILVANYHSYRVVSMYQPFPYAIRVSNSQNIRFRNVHVYSNSKASFDNSLFDQPLNTEIRYREIGSLNISGEPKTQQKVTIPPVLASGAKVEKLCDGFFNISGAVVDNAGRLYFVDTHWQHIYRWSPETRQLDIVRDSPLDPSNLAIDKSGNIMVFSYAGKGGTVYSFKPDTPEDQITFLNPQPAVARPGMGAYLPADHYGDEGIDFSSDVPDPKPYQYVSPDGSTFVPAGKDFVDGALSWGVKMADVLRAFGFAKAKPGKPFYVSDESAEKTYSAQINAAGMLTHLKLFAERGGESVVSDDAGNVYIAAGQVFVYNPDGKQIGVIEVPQRPIDILFGGKNDKTLFILARNSLYAVQLK